MDKLPAVITSLDTTLATRDVIAVRRLHNGLKGHVTKMLSDRINAGSETRFTVISLVR